MIRSREDLQRRAADIGYRPEILEKVLRLLDLLEGLDAHPELKGHLALKGGTALNLFHLDVARLSVDIDLNYIGAGDLQAVLERRPRLEQAIRAVCSRKGMQLERAPRSHAGGKWRFRYDSALGGRGNLELDINFMYRTPLWESISVAPRPIGDLQGKPFVLLDIHELVAGKLTALFGRHASRDLFDVHRVLTRELPLDLTRLRLAFVVYGAANPKDWRKVAIDQVSFDPRELKGQLLPVLRRSEVPPPEQTREWAEEMVRQCRDRLDCVLPLEPHERDFIDALLDHGEIRPELLTSDPMLCERIQNHPALQWRAGASRASSGR